MKIVVIGGTGLIGTKLGAKLRSRGHEVVAASPATGVNSLTGEGLAEALAGAEVLVDVANSPSFEDQAALDFFKTSGRNLLSAEAAAGVRHHVALSVVGTERLLDSGYFRAKMAQEELIKASPIPCTILRSTQFFEFMGAIAHSGADGETVRLPPALMRPIASEDVATALADVTLAEPAKGTLEVAGPDERPLVDFVGRYLEASKDPRKLVIDAKAAYFGLVLDDSSLTPSGSARLMPTHFEDWLARSLAGSK